MIAWLLANKTLWKYIAAVALLICGVLWLTSHDHRIRADAKAVCEAKFAQASEIAAIAYEADRERERQRIALITESYEQKLRDIAPLSVGVGNRVYKYALRTCPLSETPADTPSPGGTPAGPESPGEIEQAIDDLARAAAHDALQVKSLQDAWPK